jgi:hypothetical protein
MKIDPTKKLGVRISTGFFWLTVSSSGGHTTHSLDILRLKHMFTKLLKNDGSYLSNRFVKAYFIMNAQFLKLVNRVSASLIP